MAVTDYLVPLINYPSFSPDQTLCQRQIGQWLDLMGFVVEYYEFDGVPNLWAQRGTGIIEMLWMGHSDIVPVGDTRFWHSDPLCAEIRDGFLYGRGACDMKGGIAAMLTGCEHFIAKYPDHPGAIGFLITGDEEMGGVNGAAKVSELLSSRGVSIRRCLIAEPSSYASVADTIRPGRRGILHGVLRIQGLGGHVGDSEQIANPLYAAAKIIDVLASTQWDVGGEEFSPTSFQISHIRDLGSHNIVPEVVEVDCDFRFFPGSTPADLKSKFGKIVERCLEEAGRADTEFSYSVEWNWQSGAYYTQPCEFRDLIAHIVTEVTSLAPCWDTGGGASDGYYFHSPHTDVIELGPVNYSAHKTNECVSIEDLEILAHIYMCLLERILFSLED